MQEEMVEDFADIAKIVVLLIQATHHSSIVLRDCSKNWIAFFVYKEINRGRAGSLHLALIY